MLMVAISVPAAGIAMTKDLLMVLPAGMAISEGLDVVDGLSGGGTLTHMAGRRASSTRLVLGRYGGRRRQ